MIVNCFKPEYMVHYFLSRFLNQVSEKENIKLLGKLAEINPEGQIQGHNFLTWKNLLCINPLFNQRKNISTT